MFDISTPNSVLKTNKPNDHIAFVGNKTFTIILNTKNSYCQGTSIKVGVQRAGRGVGFNMLKLFNLKKINIEFKKKSKFFISVSHNLL